MTKYLGLTILLSGNSDLAMKDLAEQAQKVYYANHRSLQQFNPLVRMWLKWTHPSSPSFHMEVRFGHQHDYDSWDKTPPETFHLELCKKKNFESIEKPPILPAGQK